MNRPRTPRTLERVAGGRCDASAHDALQRRCVRRTRAPGRARGMRQRRQRGSTTTAAASGEAPTPSGTIDFFGWEGEDLTGVAPMEAFLKSNGAELKASYTPTLDDITPKLQGNNSIDLLAYTSIVTERLQTADILAAPRHREAAQPRRAAAALAGGQPAMDRGRRAAVRAVVLPDLQPDVQQRRGQRSAGRVSRPAGARVQGSDRHLGGAQRRLRRVLRHARPRAGPGPQGPPRRPRRPVLAVHRPVEVGGRVTRRHRHPARLRRGDCRLPRHAAVHAVRQRRRRQGRGRARDVVDIKGGNMSFTDGYGIPNGADNPDSAYAFINQVLDPKTNAAISEAFAGGVVVEGAEEFLPADRRSTRRTRSTRSSRLHRCRSSRRWSPTSS